jgi:hypothetical protein
MNYTEEKFGKSSPEYADAVVRNSECKAHLKSYTAKRKEAKMLREANQEFNTLLGSF